MRRTRGEPAPRSVLIAALERTLPRSAADLVLARVWIETDHATRVLEIEDVFDGRFSALARTTAFPATALIDLVLREEITLRGVYSMQRAVDGARLIDELRPVGINVVERSDRTVLGVGRVADLVGRIEVEEVELRRVQHEVDL